MATIVRNGAGTYTVRWRELGGRSAQQREKTFRLRREAQAFANTVEADKSRGFNFDPSAGRMTFSAYVREWSAAQVLKPTTWDTYERHLRNHIVPAFGGLALASIRPTRVQGWVRHLSEKGLAPSTVNLVYGIFAGIMKAAERD